MGAPKNNPEDPERPIHWFITWINLKRTHVCPKKATTSPTEVKEALCGFEADFC